MTIHTFGPDDPLRIALEQMGRQTGYVSPVLIVHGADAAGTNRTGTLDLHLSQAMTFPQKRRQVASVGTFAATLQPYFVRLDELYFINKSVLDLQAFGKGREEGFIISHVEVKTKEFTTKVFTLLQDTSGIKGVRVVTDRAELVGIVVGLPYQLLRVFIKSYRDAKPED